MVRFLDDRLRSGADVHNRTALAAIASSIVDIPDDAERRRTFGSMCLKAVERYGGMGNLVNEISPKAQLCQWATFA